MITNFNQFSQERNSSYINPTKFHAKGMMVLISAVLFTEIIYTIKLEKSLAGLFISAFLFIVSVTCDVIFGFKFPDRYISRYMIILAGCPMLFFNYYFITPNIFALFILLSVLALQVYYDKDFLNKINLFVVVSLAVITILKFFAMKINIYELFLQLFIYPFIAFICNKINFFEISYNVEKQNKIKEFNDEKEKIINNLNISSKEIKNSIKTLDDFSDSLRKKMLSSKTSVDSISDLTVKTASSIKEQKEINAEISDIVDKIESESNEVRNIANISKDQISQGRVYITTLSETALEVENNVKSFVDEINELVKETENIRNITSSIKQIAENTNLLSFNANVEAVRAGQIGAGFSVVAGEIRKLSDNAQSYTKKIEEKLSYFVKEIYEITKITEESADSIHNEVELMKNVDKSFDLILKDFEDTYNQVEKLLVKCNELTASNEDIMEKVIKLDESSHKVTLEAESAIKNVNESTENSVLINNQLNDVFKMISTESSLS